MLVHSCAVEDPSANISFYIVNDKNTKSSQIPPNDRRPTPIKISIRIQFDHLNKLLTFFSM